jgi:hypothetical protein
MKGALGFPKRPQLPEAELYGRLNAASAAMAQVGGWQKVKIFTKKRPVWTPLAFSIYRKILSNQYTKRKLESSAFQNRFSHSIHKRQCQDLNRGAQGFGWRFLPLRYCTLQ